MAKPWFDPNLYSWIPGVCLGIAGGVWGSVCGTLVPLGRARWFVLGCALLCWLASLGLLIAAVVAVAVGQPYGVWYGLGLPGLVGTILFSVFVPMTWKFYQQVEQRKIQARDAALS